MTINEPLLAVFRRIVEHIEPALQCPSGELVKEHLTAAVEVDLRELRFRIRDLDVPLRKLWYSCCKLIHVDASIVARVHLVKHGEQLEVYKRRDSIR